MRRFQSILAAATIAVFGAAQLQPPLYAQDPVDPPPTPPTYSVASLTGPLVFSETGTVNNTSPLTVIGLVNADGAGNLIGTVSQNQLGAGTGLFSVRGKYTVSEDGTGQMTLAYLPLVPGGTTVQDGTSVPEVYYNLVVSGAGSTVKASRTNIGFYTQAELKKQD